MATIFSSAKEILEKSSVTPAQLSSVTKVMLSMKYSYADINEVRTVIEKDGAASKYITALSDVIASDTSLFNGVISNFKKNLSEDLTEAAEEPGIGEVNQ